MDPPAYEYLNDSDLMAALIGDLHHYAEWRGINFDAAVGAGMRAYIQPRAGEGFLYAIVGEVQRVPDGRLPSTDVVTSIYPKMTEPRHIRSVSPVTPKRRAQRTGPGADDAVSRDCH